MVIKEKVGNIDELSLDGRIEDILLVNWHETNKRIIHFKTNAGRTISLKFLQENPNLKEGDILWMDEESAVVLN